MSELDKLDFELRKKLKYDEKTKGDIVERALHETFGETEHNMQVEAYPIELDEIYDELKDLELADLLDFKKGEYGRTD